MVQYDAEARWIGDSAIRRPNQKRNGGLRLPLVRYGHKRRYAEQIRVHKGYRRSVKKGSRHKRWCRFRNHRSQILDVNGKLYWPLVRNLKLKA